MLDKPRIQAFASFIKVRGEEFLLDCLEQNERADIRYHHPGKLTGDYDAPETEEEIFHMIEFGQKQK